MTSKNFQPNQLVWAKMKGFPPWPGKVSVPPTDAKPKKNHHYIYFFGSENFAWIAEDLIDLHSENMVEKYGKRKGELFRKAVETIIDCSKGVSKHHSPTRNDENASKVTESQGKLDKITNGVPPSKKKSPQGSSSAQKIKNKLPVKKVSPVKTSVKKNSRKRTHSPDQLESCSTSVSSDGANAHEASESVPPASSLFYWSDFADPRIWFDKIGFLGLSKVGQSIVRNINEHRHPITIWSESDEHKALAEELEIKTAATPADVVQYVDITFCYVTDSEVAKDIVERDSGVLKGLERASRDRKRGFILMCPSLDPKVSHEIASLIEMKGGHYLEAPTCGSSTDAEEGNLLIIAAGDKKLYDDCNCCIRANSKAHLFVSAEVGAASKMNIVHNMLIGTVYASLAESLSLIDQVGLKSKHFFEMLQASSLNSNSIMDKLRTMMNKKCDKDENGVTLNQMQRDFNLGLSLGHDIAQHTKVFAQANEMYKLCKSKYGDHDVSAVYLGTKP